jgi:hypothetical protein
MGSPFEVFTQGQLKDTVKILGNPKIFIVTIVTNSTVLGRVLSADLLGAVGGRII